MDSGATGTGHTSSLAENDNLIMEMFPRTDECRGPLILDQAANLFWQLVYQRLSERLDDL